MMPASTKLQASLLAANRNKALHRDGKVYENFVL